MTQADGGWRPPPTGTEATTGPRATAWFPEGDPRRSARVVAPGPPPPPVPDRPASGPRPARIALLVVGVAAVVATAVIAVALSVRGGGGAPAPVAASAASATSSAASPSTVPAVPPTEVPSVASPTVSAPTTTSPTGIDIAAVATNPDVGPVATMFDTYFAGVNAHDAAAAASVFAPGGSIDPNDPGEVARFGADIATTTDSAIVVRSIAATATGLDVAVEFTSTQDASLGPDGQACTRWQIVYHLVRTGLAVAIAQASAQHQGC